MDGWMDTNFLICKLKSPKVAHCSFIVQNTESSLKLESPKKSRHKVLLILMQTSQGTLKGVREMNSSGATQKVIWRKTIT